MSPIGGKNRGKVSGGLRNQRGKRKEKVLVHVSVMGKLGVSDKLGVYLATRGNGPTGEEADPFTTPQGGLECPLGVYTSYINQPPRKIVHHNHNP